MPELSKIVVLDDHRFRAAGFVAALSHKEIDLSACILDAGLLDAMSSDRDWLPEGTSACIYVIGGVRIDDPQVAYVITRSVAALDGRPLILLVDHIDRPSIDTALAAGVRGVIPTEMQPEIALAAVQFIMAGGHYYPHSTSVRQHAPAFRPTDPGPVGRDDRACAASGVQETATCASDIQNTAGVDVKLGTVKLQLTPRQHDVLGSIEKGLTNKAIGRDLDLSESTVKVHVRHLMRKLGVTNRTQLALLVSTARSSMHDA